MLEPVKWKFNTPEALTERATAVAVLGRLLRRGELLLLLGSGVSADMGFPTWGGLVQRCAEQLGDMNDYSKIESAADLMKVIDLLRRRHQLEKADMRAVVRLALYGDAARAAAPRYPIDIIDSRILTALGAMMMRSARGSAGEVFTLNFDDAVESYLDLHGFRSQIICELPCLIRGDVDVHVYHIHGFLPLAVSEYETSSWMVFSEMELVERLAKSAEFPWESLLLNRLHSKVLLAVGTSMSDIDLRVTLQKVGQVVSDRPFGFVLGCHTSEGAAVLLEQGLIPVTFDEYSEIPEFLLRVCQAAART